MTYRVAFTSTGPLSGKTTLARHLVKHYGFYHASHSLSIATNYIETWNPVRIEAGMEPLTLVTLEADKELYRKDLQQHGYLMGFNDPDRQLEWIEYTLRNWNGDTDVVFEAVRGEGQAQTMRDIGFTIVQVAITEAVREIRAVEMGKDYNKIVEAMEADPYLERGIANPDITLDGSLPTDVQARIILTVVERQGYGGYQIFGSTVHPRG